MQTTKWRVYSRRTVASILAMVLTAQIFTFSAVSRDTQKKAEPQYLEAAEMPEEIMNADTFFVGTTSADLQEKNGGSYLLKIGRGGEAENAASVTLKLSDASAKYGKDYKVSIKTDDGTVEATNPDSNKSLVELIGQNKLTEEQPIGDQEEQEEALQKAYEELFDKASEDSDDSSAEEVVGPKQTSENALKKAKEAMSGEKSDRGTVTSSKQDMVQALSETSNSLTSIVEGATLNIDFAKGEKEKYVEITTIDNRDSDGDRIFYAALAQPSNGYTNSMVSESMFTIKDDEPEAKAVVSFEKAEYSAEDGKVTVVVKREGAITQTVSATMKSKSGTARSGVEFSPVNADVVFPFGVTERKLEIKTDNSYIEKDVDFSLTLTNKAGTSVGKTGTAKIIVKADGNSKSGKGDVKAQDINNTVYAGGIPLNINTVKKVRGDGGFNVNSERIHVWVDDEMIDAKVALSGVRNSSNVDWGDQYVYDGVQFRWSKTSSRPSWSNTDVAFYVAGSDSNVKVWLETGDEPRFDPENRTYYFGQKNASAVKFYTNNWRGYENDLYIWWVMPIKRPFKVSLKAADPLTYLDGNGNRVINKNSVATSLSDYNSEWGYALKYEGSSILISANNNQISKLTGVRIWNGSSYANISSNYYTSDGGKTITIKLTNEFVKAYHNYVKFEGNGGAKLAGNIQLQPVYDYLDSKIIVKPNEITANEDTDTFAGILRIDGNEVNVGKPSNSYNKELSYHIGDMIKIDTKVIASDYSASGVVLESYNLNNHKYEAPPQTYENGSYPLYIERNEYKLTPTYSKNDNIIRIKIHKDDLSKFEKTGILSQENINKAEISGDYRLITVVDTTYQSGSANVQLKAGQEFRFAVTPLSGYQPVWKEINNANYYVTNSFTYRAQGDRVRNVISLYAGAESASYVSVKGKLFYENFMLTSKSVGTPILPAKDGYLTLSGQFAVPDSNGTVQTNAFHPVDYIMVAGKKVTFGTERKLYTRMTVAAGNSSEVKDIALSLSGTKGKVTNGTAEVDAYITDLQNISVRVNSNGPKIAEVMTTNRGLVYDRVMMNDELTQISVSVTDVPTEGIKEVNFLIYDRYTFEEKSKLQASKSLGGVYTVNKTFKSDGSEIADYDEGDLIYVQVVTNESKLTGDVPAAAKMTVYAPVYTGYCLAVEGRLDAPTVQSLNLGTFEGLAGIPMLNNFNSTLAFGPINLTVSDLYDDKENVIGSRIQVGMELVFDKTSWSSEDEDGENFFEQLGDLKKTFKDTAKQFSDIRNKAKEAGSYKDAVKGLASMGNPKFGVTPFVAFYLDFAYRVKVTSSPYGNGEDQTIEKSLVCIGGGIFAGVKGEFSMAWYALVPVVFIPCYFGVQGELSLSITAGLTTNVTHKDGEKKEELTYEEMTTQSHNISESLDFDFKLGIAGEIQIYCGVGICGTLGVRGGLDVEGQFLWYPTLSHNNSYFDPYGLGAAISAALWIDLLVFNIPFKWELASRNYKLLAQYDELAEKSEEERDKILAAHVVPSGQGVEPESTSEITYELKARNNKPSKWTGNVKSYAPGDVSTMATFKEKNTTTLLSDGYDRPDSQLIEMGDNGTLLVFLQDDKTKTDAERTALSYSVFKDGKYSTPVIIQIDKTADFQPSIADAGENVIITWISSDPAADKGDQNAEGYEANYLKSQEVYCLSVAKADLAANKAIDQSAIVRLTDDEFYDAQPYAVYDSKSGDINVYYIKSAEDTDTAPEAADLANPMNSSGKTYSVMAYRVYENGKGWLTTEYAEKEKPSNVSDEEYAAQLEELGGQRLLSSPISDKDINKEDPLIADFKAIGYNGIGIFAYTIDKDMNADTDADRDLFIQLYDFETRSTYVPIRITDDEVADTMPQLIRNGTDENGTTYLFWMSDNKLKYIDVSSLVKYGVDENGQIIKSALSEGTTENSEGSDEDVLSGLSAEQEQKATYSFTINEVTAYHADDNINSSYSDYQVAVDKNDNLYVIWIQNSSDGTKDPNQEIYAAAMIKSDVKTDGNIEKDSNIIKTWSDANRLTNFGMFCDEPAIAITNDDQMIMVYNKYDIDKENLTYKDLKLTSSVLEPYCSVEASEISYSDITPEDGQDVDVTVKFKNNGLTTSKNGFTADIYEKASDGTTKLITAYDYDESLIPTAEIEQTFTYKADSATPRSSIYVSVKEKDVQGVNNKDGEKFESRPDYTLEGNSSYQDADGSFYTNVTVTNSGNEESKATDKLELAFNGPYGTAKDYGIDNKIFASEQLTLKPGESKDYKIQLNVPAEAFSKYGFIDVLTRVTDGENNYTAANDPAYMSQPAGLKINDGKDITMNEGEELALTLDYCGSDFLNTVEPMFVSSDNSVVKVENGKLVTAGGGETTVTAYAYPYNSATSVKVTVKSTTEEITEPDVEPETKVTSVKLNKTLVNLSKKGKTAQLKAAVKPSDATNTAVKWTSSNTKVATVSSKGLVTAKAKGYAYIKATAKDGSNKSAKCLVVVGSKVKKLTLSKKTVNLKKGKKVTLKAKTDKNAACGLVSWKSTNTKVAAVSSKGVVTAKKKGYAYIKATAKDGSKKSAKCLVVVGSKVKKLTLSKKTATVKKGKKLTLKAATDKNAACKLLEWTSSDTKVAAVSSKGVVTAKKKGKCTITVKALDGSKKQAKCKLTVK